MKRIILLIILFFSAVAISPLLVKEKGYILIAMDDLTIESTVVNAVIMLVLTFIVLLMALRLFKGSMSLGLLSWNKVAFASRRRAQVNFNKGIAAYILEDYQQAEHLFAKSAEPASMENSAYLLAAAAGEKQAKPENTQHYLTLLEKLPTTKSSGLAPTLVKLKLLLAHNQYAQARLILDEHHKEIGHDYRLLTIEIELCVIEQRFLQVIDYLVMARKEKHISSERIAAWESTAFSAHFNQMITEQDQKALHNYWLNLSKKIRQQNNVVFAYCQTLAQHNINEPLTDILLPALKKGNDEIFLKQIRALPVQGADPLIALVQRHLHKDEKNTLWLSCLAHIAANDKQWQMAEKAFNSLLHLPEPEVGHNYDDDDLTKFASVLTQLGKHEKANSLLRKLLAS